MGFRSHMELCKVGNMFGIDILIHLLRKHYVCLVAFSPFINAAFNLEVQYDQFINNQVNNTHTTVSNSATLASRKGEKYLG